MRRKEGYLLIDNRASGGEFREAGTSTCTHCQRVVVLNPLRTRERAYCRGCDHYICDPCAATLHTTLTCVPIARTFDTLEKGILRGQAIL